jgi:hypothetical protein
MAQVGHSLEVRVAVSITCGYKKQREEKKGSNSMLGALYFGHFSALFILRFACRVSAKYLKANRSSAITVFKSYSEEL